MELLEKTRKINKLLQRGEKVEYKPKDSSDNRISLYCHFYCQADHKKDQPYRQ